ncbi:MAG: hypothetical protein IIY87_03120 [Bacteroidales bacterium]|nr:hypothetical protein [Bacteroidales bacterium]
MDAETSFKHYAELLSGMNRAVMKGYRAPHKLVLLMAICELVEEGKISNNQIPLTKELENKFKDLWRVYVDSDEVMPHDHVAEELFGGEKKTYPFKCNIANPFYHLSGEPFWMLKKSAIWRQRTSWSVAALRSDYDYAEIDADLFSIMNDSTLREQIVALLISMI